MISILTWLFIVLNEFGMFWFQFQLLTVAHTGLTRYEVISWVDGYRIAAQRIWMPSQVVTCHQKLQIIALLQ